MSHPVMNSLRRSTSFQSGNQAQTGDQNPLDLYLEMELDCGRAVVSVINATMASLSKVLNGTEILGTKVHEEASQLMDEQIPTLWGKAWQGPTNASAYCQAVVSRCSCIDEVTRRSSASVNWLEPGQGSPVNLSSWFYPSALLNALHQYAARKLCVTIDNLKMVTCWGPSSRDLQAVADVFVQIEGLRIQGGCFDGIRLELVTEVN